MASSLVATAAQAAHSLATSILAHAQIQVGQTIPPVEVKEDSPETTKQLELKGKNILGASPIFLAKPAGFTSPASDQDNVMHGIDRIAIKRAIFMPAAQFRNASFAYRAGIKDSPADAWPTAKIGVPGAFTAPCNAHLPGYIDNYDNFKNKGVTGIYVFAVNDAFVTKAWKEKLAPNGTPIHFIADDKGHFVSLLGLIFDASGLLGGPRSKRFAIVTEGNKVFSVAVEDEAPKVTVTGADSVLSTL